MERPKVTVKLAHPFEFHDKRVVAIDLREPRGADYIKLGEPTVTVFLQAGGAYVIEQPKVIADYFEACVDHEMGGDVFAMLSFADARAVKKALLGFFSVASDDEPKPKSTTSSSSLA